MTVKKWVSGAAGDWNDPSNWLPAGAPAPGDRLIVENGLPAIAGGSIVGETISIRGSVTLNLGSVTFRPGSGHPLEIFVAGQPDKPISPTFAIDGETSLSGSLYVEPMGGGLAIDLGGSGSSFTITDDGFVLVTQEASLAFTGSGRVINDGLIHVEGEASIDPGVALRGQGVVELANHAHLTADGAIRSNQTILFADGTSELTIAEADDFHALIGFTGYGGDRILLEGVRARSVAFDDGVLTLYRGKHHSGPVEAELSMGLFFPLSLTPLPSALKFNKKQDLSAKDFTLERDGHDTALVYDPATTYLQASLPVPVIAEAGEHIALATLFKDSFGTANPGFHGIKLLPPWDLHGERQYWGQPDVNGMKAVLSTWIVNGKAITRPIKVTADDEVFYRVGNSIGFPPQLQVQVTEKASGRKAEYVDYSIWAVDPAVADLVRGSGLVPGRPTPQDILNSAASYEAVYGLVHNTDLCNWIADNVAAAAGAAMPLPDADLDPLGNVDGGFWRVAYRGTDSDAPVADWNTLVQPGDIVRMKWETSVSGHTTTVLAVLPNGKLEVYDNGDEVDGESVIGPHGDVVYWKWADPASITIYRLDPDQQYLIEGRRVSEVIQGSVFDDLIHGRRGADEIAGSIGNDEIDAGHGRDRVLGGKGNDTLTGGDGGDRLDGGPGANLYAYDAIRESTPGAAGRDTILGFDRGADRIDLSPLNAAREAKGKPAFFFIGDKPLSGHAGQLDYVKHDGFVLLRGDGDGDGAADFAIKVRGVTRLDADDFLL